MECLPEPMPYLLLDNKELLGGSKGQLRHRVLLHDHVGAVLISNLLIASTSRTKKSAFEYDNFLMKIYVCTSVLCDWSTKSVGLSRFSGQQRSGDVEKNFNIYFNKLLHHIITSLMLGKATDVGVNKRLLLWGVGKRVIDGIWYFVQGTLMLSHNVGYWGTRKVDAFKMVKCNSCSTRMMSSHCREGFFYTITDIETEQNS